MADLEGSLSPSMYSTCSRVSEGDSESVLGTTVNVPAAVTPRRTLFPGTSNEEQTSTSVGRTPSTPSSPRYLTWSASNKQSLDMDDVIEDENDMGDGDSVVESPKLEELNESAKSAENDRLKVLIKLEDDSNDSVLDVESNQIRFDLVGLDEDTKLPKPPQGWQPKPPNKQKKEPDFVDVDNPGGWSEYTFYAKFVEPPKPKKGMKAANGDEPKKKRKKKGEDVTVYSHHQLPTGLFSVHQATCANSARDCL